MTELPGQADVLIAGAGPAGSATAAFLARAGCTVLPVTFPEAALGGFVREQPDAGDNFVELQVEVAEVRAHDVPVRLLALNVEFDPDKSWDEKKEVYRLRCERSIPDRFSLR